MKLSEEQVNSILGKSPDIHSVASVSLQEIEDFGGKESIIEMFNNIAAYNKMLQERITFVNDDLTKIVPFTRENLYLMCAFSGSGKSTASANISHPLWKQQKKTLIISNEEAKQDILFRIAAIEIGVNFNDYKKGRMDNETKAKVMALFPDIGKYVKVIDVNYKGGFTTKIESVCQALDVVSQEDYSCVMIDYLQLITGSVVPGDKRPRFEILNDFKKFIGLYIKRANCPVVLFAQLHSAGKRSKDIDSRIKDVPSIMEPATVVIEIVPNFKDKSTEFLIVKDRFGMQGTKLTCAFHRGRFITMTEEHKKQVLQERLDNIKNGIAVPSVDDEEEDEESDYQDAMSRV